MSAGAKPSCPSSGSPRSTRPTCIEDRSRDGRVPDATSNKKSGVGARSGAATIRRHSMPGSNRNVVILQERDVRLLRELAVMRVIDREQAKVVAGFGSTTRANARLLALTSAGLLRRVFLGTTASGRKALYSSSKRGAQLVEVPYRGLRLGTD